MALDSETLHALHFQANKRRYWLGMCPPERNEAELCMRRVDDILDRRPRPIAVAGDGETILDDQSGWVRDQADVSLFTNSEAINNTGRPERVLTADEYGRVIRHARHAIDYDDRDGVE